MAKILIDLYKSKNPYSGLGQFSIQFARELLKHQPEYLNLNFSFLTPQKNKLELPKSVQIIEDHFKLRFLNFLNPVFDIWHSLYQFPSHLPNKKTKQILTIHDLNFLLEKTSAKSEKYLKRLQKNVDRADSITTISKYTKGVIEQNLDLKGKKVHVIYNGVQLNIPLQESAELLKGNQKFFFSIGIFNQKKNFHVLIDLMEKLKDFKLIIAGDHHTEYGKVIEAKINRLRLSERVILAGKISDSEKYWYYQHCEALLFPSLAEGFGLPVIEAMLLGKPVFLSKFTSLPEIGGDLAYYFDNFDPFDMKSLIESKLSQYHFQEEINQKNIKNHAQKFSWENSIKQYLEIYSSMIK